MKICIFFINYVPIIASFNRVKTSKPQKIVGYQVLFAKNEGPYCQSSATFLNLEESFPPFLTLFQKKEPLTRILYEQLSDLVRTIMLRFLKSDSVGNWRGAEIQKIGLEKKENQVFDEEIVNGESTRTLAFKKIRLETWIRPIDKIRKFCQRVTKYLIKNQPLNKKIFENLESRIIYIMYHPGPF